MCARRNDASLLVEWRPSILGDQVLTLTECFKKGKRVKSRTTSFDQLLLMLFGMRGGDNFKKHECQNGEHERLNEADEQLQTEERERR